MTNQASRKKRAFSHLTIPLLIGLLLALPLTACGQAKDADTKTPAADSVLIDEGLVSGTPSASPAQIALNDQALIKNLDAARVMRAPKPIIIPAQDCSNCSSRSGTLGERATKAGAGRGSCDAKMQIGDVWAKRMPPEFPIYPNSQLKEAGGIDGGVCDLRVVSFTTVAPMQDVIDFYYTRANYSGFNAEHQIRDSEHILGGTREKDGGAYFITFNTAADKSTIVDIVANKGR